MKKFCEVCGKEIPETNQQRTLVDGKSMLLCGKHYAQYRKFGKFTDVSAKTVFDSNDFKIDGDKTYVYTTTKNQEVSGFFIIDTEDLDRVITHKWRLWNNRFYTGVQNPIEINKFILNVPVESGYDIDHINNDTSDNRKCNLRICTHQQNIQNSPLKSNNVSGFSGIGFDKTRNKWTAEIKCNYIKCFLGRYDNLEDACFVRYFAETLLFKEFRNTKNDCNLLPLVEKCQRKEELTTYVKNRIELKYPNSK